MIGYSVDNADPAVTREDIADASLSAGDGGSPAVHFQAMTHTDHCTGPGCWACSVRAGRPQHGKGRR